MQQINNQFDGTSIQPSFSDQKIGSAIKFSALLSFIAFGEIIELSTNESLQKQITDLYKQVEPWLFNFKSCSQ